MRKVDGLGSIKMEVDSIKTKRATKIITIKNDTHAKKGIREYSYSERE